MQKNKTFKWDMKCVCGSNIYNPILQVNLGRNWIIKCLKCRTYRTYPLPPHSENSDIYKEEDIKTRIENKTLWESFIKPNVPMVKKYKKTGSWLDIGCNIGQLVELAKEEGYAAFGIDLNKKAVAYGKERGLNLKCTKNLNIFKKNSFDIISLTHVFEHVIDPNKLLRDIHRILKKKGILFLDSPDILGLSPRILGKYWRGWCVNLHIWQYSHESLCSLLEANGFIIKKVYKNKKNFYINFLKGTLKDKIEFSLNIIGKLINMTDQVQIIAIKNEK